MTRAEMAHLVARIDRLWYGTKLAEAMGGDRPMFDEWFGILGRVGSDDAMRAVQALNEGDDRFPPRPGQIRRRAEEIAEARRRSQPADLSHLALPDGEEPATPEQWARFNAAVGGLLDRRRLRVVER